MASAWFLDRERGYTRGVKLFCFKNELTQVDEVWRDGFLTAEGRSTKTSFDDRAACVAAYEKRCEEVASKGWITRRRASYGEPKPTPTRAQTEAALESLSAELAEALVAAAGDAAAEESAIARALGRYRAARSAIGEPPDEYALHFFSVDGVGLEASRAPAFARPRPDAATFARWMALLERAATARSAAAARPPTKPSAKKPRASAKSATKAPKPAAKKAASRRSPSKKAAPKKVAARPAKKAPPKKATSQRAPKRAKR